GSFSSFLWGFVDGKPIVNRFRRPDQVPASTPLSDALSKELKRRGMNFVGPTICYAYMQSIGMVNDHLIDCPQHPAAGKKAKRS
ncbi:MAG: DNA-3-methyladenine glycosylase I, partial [Acidobacteria bacterium]|nr:DNA-3-methyladenine glycosylase I [Acidobacteriota bacterium]NIQ86877.1 DNA-3-methyladenine glycosylase I [Acidobacteriota bacterium]